MSMSDEKWKWVIVGKEGCVWCEKTKKLLHDHDIEFVYMEAKDSLREFLINNNLITVPQVYANGWLVGGHEDTELWLNAHWKRMKVLHG